MKNRIMFALCSAVLSLLLISGCLYAVEKPQLVLQITVDGLRGDLPYRYRDRFGAGGFRYLLKNGAVFTNAHYQHANTETIVGHTTLATGAFPADHGMIGNLWLDRKTSELSYNIEDSEYAVVGSGSFVDKKTEIDPTQKAARTDGRSPRAILASTFSDELLVSTNGKAKVFAVSVKDRGAVPLAGHGGKAFWFNKKDGHFISSSFYYDEYPAWVTEWNTRKNADTYLGKSWQLKDEPETYLLKESDDRPFEIDLKGYGRVFPHSFGNDPKYFYTFLTLSPVGDMLTLDFAKSLVKNEKLGKDDITDYLSISFSSTDYVSHIFGPSSLESEDNLLHLDRTLADLFAFIEEEVGIANTLIVFSADHGNPEAAEQISSYGIETRRLSPERVDTDEIFGALKAEFGLGKDLITIYYHPYIYLDRSKIAEMGLEQQKVEQVIADEIKKIQGIALAYSSTAIRDGEVIDSQISKQVANNYHPERSGDIYVIQEPYTHLVSDESTPLASMHGSPWRYDTYVPIIFAGASVEAARIDRLVHPVDIAITLSNYLEIKPPSSAAGVVLDEVIK